MRVLVADDNAVSRAAMAGLLEKWGYEPHVVEDGAAAWVALRGAARPAIAVLDWLMPAPDGLELCRRIRSTPDLRHLYVILVTGREATADVVTGLSAGANDYVTKPFEPTEFQARLSVGARVVTLQQDLAAKVRDLEAALAREQKLFGLLPICSYCKKVRDDRDYWHQVEAYVTERSSAQFSHSICPACFETVVKPELEAYRATLRNEGGGADAGGGAGLGG
ncbi:MAG: response regulator [Planctomycetes bacterium]|nr:response regulator [Planctomycetota bacterium]